MKSISGMVKHLELEKAAPVAELSGQSEGQTGTTGS